MSRSAVVNVLNYPIFFGKSLLTLVLRSHEMLWARLPTRIVDSGPMRAYGRVLHALVLIRKNRTFYFGTLFLRNRPQLDLLLRLIDRKSQASGVSVTVVACSIGADVYTLAHTIRSQRPDQKLAVNAVDISKEAVDFARAGVYPLAGSKLTDENIFARLTEQEMRELFHAEAKEMRIRNWIAEDITWHVGDAGDPVLANLLGPQDIVVANNFLCHMYPADAEGCLRNVVRLVKPGGYLFVSGVDLDVRTKVARDLMLEPVTELIQEIHDGDPSLTKCWPFRYWGLEPLNRRRHDWQLRYSSVFRVAGNESVGTSAAEMATVA